MSGPTSTFPYHRIVDDLRADIISGRLVRGDRLPSEHELSERYRTSRPTVRRAIALLKAQGLVVTEQGRGAFVRPTPHVRLLLSGSNYRRHRKLGVPGFNAQAIEQGQLPEQRLVDVQTIDPPPDISLRLDLDEQASVVVRRRLFLINDQPVATCDSYYPSSLAAGTPIAEHKRIKGGVHAVIEDPKGSIRRRIARSVDDITARMPRACLLILVSLVGQDGLMVRSGVIGDELWSVVEPVLPSEVRAGRPWNDHRLTLEGICWRFRTGAPWRDVPAAFGAWQSVWERHRRWSDDGTYDRMFAAVRGADRQDPGMEDMLGVLSVDSTSVRAHQHAAGAPRVKRG